MANEQQTIYAPAVIDFITVAAEYCLFLEQLNGGIERRPFLERLTKLLPLIYVKATLLPHVETLGIEELPEAVSEADYNGVQHAVWQQLRADDGYLEVFTPEMQFSDEPLTANISEDLADIYQDLKNFVAAFADRNEVNMNNALVEVQEHFATYWGQKLVNVMRPLHDLLYGRHEEDNEAFDGE